VSALADLQHALQAYLHRDERAVVARIADHDQVDPDRRLRIYFDAYRLRLVEVLASDYEALRTLMGDEAFNAAARAYVEATPSACRNVRWYGAGLPAFLGATSPWAQQPLLAELASFEWTLTLAFDAADATVVRFEELAGLPARSWPALGFALHPSVHLLELHTNAAALRKAQDAGEPLPEAKLTERSKTWLVWRRQLAVHFRSLSETEAYALAAIRAGADFTTMCEGLCRWFSPEDAAPQAASWLRQWIDDELISDLTV